MTGRRFPSLASRIVTVEHAPHNAMKDAGEIARFRDRCSELMAALLDELARTPGVARTFPEVEAALGWPRRRIASVLGGVSHMRHTEFGGCRPYRFLGQRESESGRWEVWTDAAQAAALRQETAECETPRIGGQISRRARPRAD